MAEIATIDEFCNNFMDLFVCYFVLNKAQEKIPNPWFPAKWTVWRPKESIFSKRFAYTKFVAMINDNNEHYNNFYWIKYYNRPIWLLIYMKWLSHNN